MTKFAIAFPGQGSQSVGMLFLLVLWESKIKQNVILQWQGVMHNALLWR